MERFRVGEKIPGSNAYYKKNINVGCLIILNLTLFNDCNHVIFLQVPEELKFSDSSFLRQMLFCQSSTSIREVASLLVVSLAQNPARRPLIIDLLTRFDALYFRLHQCLIIYFLQFSQRIRHRRRVRFTLPFALSRADRTETIQSRLFFFSRN